MSGSQSTWVAFLFCAVLLLFSSTCPGQQGVLPTGVKAVWDITKAYRETTETRERICINGLWYWQPGQEGQTQVPIENWGYLKVPGAWSDGTQTRYPHPTWRNQSPNAVDSAWYQREITIPNNWQGRRIAIYTEYLNSYAVVYLDGKRMGEMYFPWGEVDITSACRPGGKHVLSLSVTAVPLAEVMEAFTDTGTPKLVKGRVGRRGLCGDVYLTSTPKGAYVGDVKVNTSVRKWEIAFETGLMGLQPGKSYALKTEVSDDTDKVKDFASGRFTAANLKDGRWTFTAKWKPDKLWDVHTPGNMSRVQLSLVDSAGKVLDTFQPVRFGFREFWIDGRDFFLNGTRFQSFILPIDNAQSGAALCSYDGARETMLRDKSFGVNAVYTHNYGSPPGAHLSFNEMMRAGDDVGMLLAISQPHYRSYNWKGPDAEKTNGYARVVEFYVRMAQNHPSVVMYSMNHNALSYAGCYNPDLIDGRRDTSGKIGPRTDEGGRGGLRSQAVVESIDPTRVVYHHSSGNLGSMHTNNLYLNFVPIQERSDWFEHWATEGVKPLLLCEYGAPWGMTWTLYRGWYKGKRAWGSATLPYEVCEAEWNAQFLGDRAFDLCEADKANLRWETKQFRAGREWHKWDYPFNPSAGQSQGQPDKDEVWAMYITDNWRAFRTWGVSAFNAWGYGSFWKLRDGADAGRKTFKVDWDDIQKPGFSPDYVDRPRDRVDMGFERADWIPTAAGKALIRNNMPLLAYIGGKPERFTSKDHNFLPGQTVQKQLIIINNSRETVTCDCSWQLAFPQVLAGEKKVVLESGKQERIPLQFVLPAELASATYRLTAQVKFSTGETQTDTFDVDVLASMPPVMPKTRVQPRVALFDPKSETAKLLKDMYVPCTSVPADADLANYDVLVVGKGALTVNGPAPDISRVRDGLKVILFEQTAEVMEKRFGFRVQEYGLRRVFARVPDHPFLEGLGTQNLHDWAGEASLIPPRLTDYVSRPRYGPTIEWCGIKVTRAYRAGNQGSVASVLIEKPARGDFLSIVDGGFGLQYSPLMIHRDGKGLVVFCQLDVTGRSESDPAAERLVRNILNYASAWSPEPVRTLVYAGEPAGRDHLQSAGLTVGAYDGGRLTPDQVLVVGPGGGQTLAAHKDAIKAWLDDNGHLLAVGLGQDEANSFLPLAVKMRKTEHITSVFKPAGAGSPLTGIGPAELNNRDPREIDLVSGGADVVGNGVLATALKGRVVFCQLAPWQFDYKQYYNQKRTFRATSVLVSRILGNMGVDTATPLVDRFSSPPNVTFEAAQRWQTGLYLDQAQEFDDPYRFFCW